MPIIKIFKKVYKEIPFLLMVTCLIITIIKLFKKSNEQQFQLRNIFVRMIPFTIMVKRNKQYFHLYDAFYYNNQKVTSIYK